MISLFGPRLPIDDEELEFQLATFKWLVAEFGEVSQGPLVVPTPEYFPSVQRGRHAPASLIFDDVRRAAQMENWACELRVGDSDAPAEAGDGLLLQHEGPAAPCGTFWIEDGPDGRHLGVVTYNPDMELDQQALVATFAHELGHYLLATARGTPPGGWELHELHTDLAATYLGFGIFMANAARNFRHFGIGRGTAWESRTQGYLSEGAHVTALVICQRLAGREPAEALPYLEDHLQGDLGRADQVLAKRHPDMIAAVDAVDLAAFGAELPPPDDAT